MHQQPVPYRPFISNTRARKYRQRLCRAASQYSDSSIRTLKFKLETPAQACNFADLQAFYQITDGTAAGSLLHYLLTVHLSGFRLFFKEADARAFLTPLDDAGFANSFDQHAGFTLPDFIPSRIRDLFSKKASSKGGADTRFSVENLCRRYLKEFSPKPDPARQDETRQLMQALAEAMVAHYAPLAEQSGRSAWMLIIDDPVAAATLFDQVLAERYPGLPALAPQLATKAQSGAGTIAFDPASEHQVAGTPFDLHRAAATILCRQQPADLDNKAIRAVQLALTTQTHAGLSWLLGSGWKLLCHSTLDEACAAYAIPPSRRHSMQAVLDAARAIPTNSLFPEIGYAAFRTNLGGRIDGWLGNYLKRLAELQTLLTSLEVPLDLPPALTLPECAWMFEKVGFRPDELQQDLQHIQTLRAQAQLALQRLMGRLPGVSDEDIARVDEFRAYVDEVAGMIELLHNQFQQLAQDKEAPPAQHLPEAVRKLDWGRLQRLTRIPALNRFSGGLQDPQRELSTTASQFDAVLAASRQHFAEIQAACAAEGRPLDPLAELTRQEAEAMHKRSHSRTEPPAHYAVARLLDRIGREINRLSAATRPDWVAWFGQLQVFRRPRDFNSYFHNRRGHLFASVFSQRHQKPKDLRSGLDGPALLRQFDRQLAEALAKADSAQLPDLLRLERCRTSLWLTGLRGDWPTALAQPRLPPALLDSVPIRLRQQLATANQTAPAELLRRAFNLYHSHLSGLLVMLTRQHFFLRTRQTWVDNDALVYAPKPVQWTPPTRLWQSERPIRSVLEHPQLVWSQPGVVDVAATFTALRTQWAGLAGRHWLRQAPHDWLFRLPLASPLPALPAIQISKKGLQPGSKLSSGVFGRLIGPSSMKGLLDQCLVEPERHRWLEMTLIADQAYRQRWTWQAGQGSQIELEPAELTLSLAIPFQRQTLSDDPEQPFGERFVAIDQGERGLGYAVFDLAVSQVDPVARGTLAIPSIRRLIDKADHYRRQRQPQQKFSQRFDSTLFRMRENVAGDVCHAILGLMARYDAFPVLESSVSNLESGSRQLDRVYKAVNTHFLWDAIDAHGAIRTQWWAGAERWDHATLRERVEKQDAQGKKRQEVRPLRLHPGKGVSAFDTSKICHVCQRNVFAELRPARGTPERFVLQNGRLQLPNGEIELYALTTDKQAIRQARRLNLRTPWCRIQHSKPLNAEDLLRLVRNSLRRAPRSLQSQDTTQSQYWCVYRDCPSFGQAQHADENAAINIGRRLIERLVWPDV